MTLKTQYTNIIKDKLPPFIDSKLFCYLFLSESKSSSITSSALSLIMVSISSLFECITCSSSLSMDERKFFAIVNSIFYVSELSRLFISHLIVLYFYHCCVHIQSNCYSKNYLLLLVYNNFHHLLHAQKDS